MEDEDGEGKIMDMWSILGDQQLKDSTFGNTLKSSIDNVYTDTIEEEKQIIRYNSVAAKDSPSRNSGAASKVVFKGFKKRILAQAQETQTVPLRNISQEQQLSHPNASPKNNKDKRVETKRGKITEYAQYLGLQPSSKSRCPKCQPFTNFYATNVKQNQCNCNSTMAPMQGLSSTSESSTISHATNFKITRKVYLCAACGTYFENWNLFLHMRDIHKRHICLFCLGMFGQAERLSYHLAKKHGVPEMAFGSVEDFYSAFKGSCYLVCCTCEKVFAETDNFYNHFCSSQTKQDATANLCTLCRQTGSHASTCTFTMESNKEASPVVPVAAAMQTGSITTSVLERPINSSNKGTARRLIKNNRSKYVEDGISNSCQQYVKKASVKSVASSHVNENQTSTDPTIRDGNADDSKIDPDRDTVSETIMEVSKYVEDVCSDEAQQQQQERDVNVSPIRRISEERVVSQTDNPIEQYDSVTQTIMEVSSFTNDKENREDKYDKEDDSLRKDADESDKVKVNNETEIQIEASCKIEDTPESAKVEEEKKEEEDEDEDEDENEDENEGEDEDEEEEEEEEEENEEEEEENEEHEDEEIEDKLNESNTSCQETKDDIKEDKRQDETSLTKFDSESQASPSFVQSPISRSLFSPQHESQQDLQPKEEYPDDGSNKHEEPAPPIESQTSVSFNTVVPSSDRSLIIKICTNRNSQFSVTSTPTNDSSNAPESHEVSKELEENNNAEGSTSEEKISDTSEKEKEDSVNSYRVNDVDSSDSDSDKLAVVDSNAEEAEEAEDAEAAKEFEDKGETKDTVKTDINIREDETEFTISKDASEESKKDEREKLATSEAVVDDTQLPLQSSDGVILAGEDVPIVDFNVEGTLDSMEIEDLLKRCIDAASPFCVYCNHARHIAVNGKQLGLHMLAEHKFQPQHPAIIIQPEQFVVRVKKTLDDLECSCFNLSSYSSTNGTYNVPDVRTYECFHCRFHSAVHKELYLHNRKMHQKTILICIMCKSTFYSYSELLCHLCPGVYSPNINVKYRCCLCPVSNLPSAFRLMVHLRKRHHACDVCLESTGNQQRLSNHVWKHKLHHLCYRCGIAYRNKPDITKHLFWKHGTESVLCKKCLQKKWPHIYHFCIPPTAFVCEECGSSFSRAVALKVHKRLHSGDQPYTCNECSERFISQKLLSKHESVHRESVTVDVSSIETSNNRIVVDDEKSDKDKTTNGDNIAHSSEITKDAKEPVKKVVDVYDLPPLNLSSESDTDAEDEKEETAKEQEKTEKNGTTTTTTTTTTTITTNTNEENAEVEEEDSSSIAGATKVVASPLQATDSVAEEEQNEEDKKQEAQIMDGIWDNFKSYTASLEMQETVTNFSNKETELEIDIAYLRSIVLADHDYCVVWSDKEEKTEVTNNKEDDAIKVNNDGVEYDYSGKAESPSVGGSIVQNTACESDANKKKVKTPKKKKQNGSTSSSDSSSDSDSSSCSCGTNCSCSSSSSGSSSSSSSSSDSDSSASESSPRKSSNRGKERKKERETSQEDKLVEIENKEAPIEVENTINNLLPNEPACHAKLLLRESDLETEETDTDEDFYDEHPQQLANKLLAEKRNQLLLLAAVAPASAESTVPLNNGITDGDCVAPSPDLTATSVEDQPQQKRKIKTKKRKKTERGKQHNVTPIVESLKLNIPKALYQKNPGFSASSPAVITHRQSSRSSTPNFMGNEIHSAIGGGTESQLLMNQSVGGSGSETENKRSSKRKRIPKRFYGDSSDEETDKQPVTKWRKVETPSFASTPNVKHVPPRLSFGGKTVAFRAGHVDSSHVESHVENTTVAAAASGTESEEPEEEPAESSSESSDSDVDMTVQPQAHVTETNTQIPERSVNLYCYCQCPYDEVSEMIACDGEDCHIEWFHFECVGIMVPPKGKWYCPDCRKKHGIVQNSEDYFD